jgi:hypothetical protein
LDVVTKNLAVTLGSTLAETFTTLSACRRDALVCIIRCDNEVERDEVDLHWSMLKRDADVETSPKQVISRP